MKTFLEMGLSPGLIAALARNLIETPTPVQMQSIPVLLEGRDLIACAPTGTGKTVAYLAPGLMRLSTPSESTSRGPRLLVLAPTRELAQQVTKAAMSLTRELGTRCKVVCITGGEPYGLQIRSLGMTCELVIATPGRLLDHLRSGRLDLSRVEVLILDEADRMLDMGFSEDVAAISAATPKTRQTVCFTATMPPQVRALTQQMMRSPAQLEVAATTNSMAKIEQQLHYTNDIGHKRRLLSHWLKQSEVAQTIVFTATKRDAAELALALEEEGMSAVALHGDLPQAKRTRMLNRLRRGEAQILVATDVAARGIDVPGLSHVFNFDLPKFAEDYVHRIGRTGRAGASGKAVSFVGREDFHALRQIERLVGQKIAVVEIVGQEANFKPGEPGKRPAAGRGHTAGYAAKPRFGAARPGSKPAEGAVRGEKQPWKAGATAKPGGYAGAKRENKSWR